MRYGKQAYALFFILLFFFLNVSSQGQVLLNEVMASNASVLEDRFGEYPDWIELYNSGSEAVSLDGYYLSDDSTNLLKWQLPEMSLSADAYTLMFASGKNISEVPAFWHTVVNIGEEWRYYLPDSDIGDDWKSSLDASLSWDTGKSSFGYADNDDTTIIEQNISLYIQKELSITSINEMTDVVLYMDYDDGFVAYLNGTEIARSASMANAGNDVAYNALANNHEALMQNGGQPEAFALDAYMHLFQEGSNVLAIEVHNTNSTSSDMSCIPILVVGFSSVQESYLLGNQYVLLKNQYPHTNFKIDSDGEVIYLSDEWGMIIDSIPNIQLPVDYSYGRVSLLPDSSGYFATPTPGSLNSSEFSSGFFQDTVEIVVTGDPYSNYHQFEMQCENENDTIYYTRDLSEPTREDMIYTSPVLMNGSAVLKARILRSNSLPGPVSCRTILAGRKPELPVISINTEPENLWDYHSGIYVDGPNASQDNPHFGANYWQDWEKPVHIELYDTEGSLVFAQDAGAKIFGAWSRARDQKSMSFFARNIYGESRFEYPFFEKKEMGEYKSFILRNSGNDYNTVLFRDPIVGYLASRMGLDHQAYQPMVKYLNGAYWGLINMREKINEHFIAGNHMLDKDDINILENNVGIKHGNSDRYYEFLAFIRANNLSVDANYKRAGEYIDIENFIRYWTLNVYVDNRDWPGNNQRFWSTNAPGSLYKWIVYDAEFGMSIYDSQGYAYNTLEFSMGEGSDHTWANPDWATEVMRHLLKNAKFRQRYINSFADRMNYDFSEELVFPLIDSFQQTITDEIPFHFEKWGGSFENWEWNVNRVKAFFFYRPGYMQQHLMDRFDLSGMANIDVEVSGSNACRVRINSIQPEMYPFEGQYFLNVPIELEAIAAPGYQFVRWEGSVESKYKDIVWDMSDEGNFHAIFEESLEQADIVINEINYASSLAMDTEDWIELYNNSSAAVDLSGWSLEDESSGDSFIIPKGLVMQSGSYVVFTNDHASFRKFYPERDIVFGDLGFGFDRGGEGIALLDEDGGVQDVVVFNNVSPWPLNVEGTGSSIELINPSLENGLGDNWQASFDYEGTPCERNSVYVNVGMEPEERLPLFEVEAYPVPFRDYTTITYMLEEEQYVDLVIYSARGLEVERLANDRMCRGRHSVQWEPSDDLPAGVYILSLRTEQDMQSKRLLYLGK